MFVRNAWYVASWADDLTQQPIARRICNEPLVLYRTAEGKAAALLDRCCHRAAPLSLGKVTEQGLECGYHGLVFNAAGACVHIPGQPQIPSKAVVRSYPVVEKDSLIWIWMGETDTADPSLIVDYPYHADTENWPFGHETMPVKSNYMLVVDNLMDLTHVAFVHESTIGGDAKAHAEAKTVIERTPRGLKFTRWILDRPAPPTIAQAVSFAGNTDRWQEFEWIAPSVIKHYAGSIDAGSSDQGRREGGFQVRLFHAATPETETTCIYFWSVANGFGQEDPRTTEIIMRGARGTISEDKLMIERQQALMTDLGEDGLVDVRADAARINMRRTIDQMIKEEAGLEAVAG